MSDIDDLTDCDNNRMGIQSPWLYETLNKIVNENDYSFFSNNEDNTNQGKNSNNENDVTTTKKLDDSTLNETENLLLQISNHFTNDIPELFQIKPEQKIDYNNRISKLSNWLMENFIQKDKFPFTILRICELCFDPLKFYKFNESNKFLNALEKCSFVKSNWDFEPCLDKSTNDNTNASNTNDVGSKGNDDDVSLSKIEFVKEEDVINNKEYTEFIKEIDSIMSVHFEYDDDDDDDEPDLDDDEEYLDKDTFNENIVTTNNNNNNNNAYTDNNNSYEYSKKTYNNGDLVVEEYYENDIDLDDDFDDDDKLKDQEEEKQTLLKTEGEKIKANQEGKENGEESKNEKDEQKNKIKDDSDSDDSDSDDSDYKDGENDEEDEDDEDEDMEDVVYEENADENKPEVKEDKNVSKQDKLTNMNSSNSNKSTPRKRKPTEIDNYDYNTESPVKNTNNGNTNHSNTNHNNNNTGNSKKLADLSTPIKKNKIFEETLQSPCDENSMDTMDTDKIRALNSPISIRKK